MSKTKNSLMLLALVAVLGMAVTHPALAGDGTLDEITKQYQTASQQFGDRVISIGMKLLVILAGLQLSINMIMKLLGKIEMEELVGALIKSIITVGIFTFFIKGAGPNMLSIISLFSMAGQTGSGLPELSASAVFSQGIDLQTLMVQKFNDATGADGGLFDAVQNMVPALLMMAISLIIILAFAMLAIQMVMVQIELYLMMAVAPLLFGFGGLSYTRDIAINAFKSALASGVKLLIIYLVAGVAYTLAQTWGSSMEYVTLTNWRPLWLAVGGALLMAVMSLQLPKIAGAIMSGSTSLSAGESAAATIGAAAGVAALGVGAVAGGAAMAGGLGGMGAGANAAMAGAKHAASSVGSFLSGGGGMMAESATKAVGAGGGGGGSSQPSAPAASESGGAPRQPSAPAAGNASNASIGGAGKPDTPNQPSAPRVGLHDRLKQVESYMPNDGAQGSVQIDHRTPE